MKKIILFAAALLALYSCESLIEEFQPVVYTGRYTDPSHFVGSNLPGPTHSIAEIAALYTSKGIQTVAGEMSISGTVSTTDQPGNFYKSFYIQDATGGIEIKIGKNGLYNDYLPGQHIYVDLNGLTIGSYGANSDGNGMVQIGFSDPSGSYETSYLEVPILIDQHVKTGAVEGLVSPEVLTEAQLPKPTDTQATNHALGKLVTVKNLRYGGVKDKYGETNNSFVLLYIDSNKDKKSSANRVFVSGTDTGITTWAMSKEKMTSYLRSGVWDKFNLGNGRDADNGIYGSVADRKDPQTGEYDIEKSAYSVSQYFRTEGGIEVQLRTSGYCKFADKEIPAEVLDGSKTVNITGILNLYQGRIQMVVNDITDIEIND